MRATINTSMTMAGTLHVGETVRVQARGIVTAVEAQLVDVGGHSALPGDKATVELEIDLNTLVMEQAE